MKSSTIDLFLNRVTQGDCATAMRRLPDACVDLVVTDPPYLVHYESRDGRKIANDDNSNWMFPSFAEVFRLLKPDRYCVSFYGWGKADRFLTVWRECGLFPVGHFTFIKRYASFSSHTRMMHENAYLLAKGHPQKPEKPPEDVVRFQYSGNKMHPTQKPVTAIQPLIEAYSKPGEIVLDPFCGSGTTGIAARRCERQFVLFEKDWQYFKVARERLERNQD